MRKVAVIYWSGTGNTEKMANAVLKGAEEKGAETKLMFSSEVDPASLISYDSIAFGCPAMGAEVLEEGEFEPMFESCESYLNKKKIALFGSYGWGDGEWMRNWEDTCMGDGATLVSDSVICNGEPDEETINSCKALGALLA